MACEGNEANFVKHCAWSWLGRPFHVGQTVTMLCLVKVDLNWPQIAAAPEKTVWIGAGCDKWHTEDQRWDPNYLESLFRIAA